MVAHATLIATGTCTFLSRFHAPFNTAEIEMARRWLRHKNPESLIRAEWAFRLLAALDARGER